MRPVVNDIPPALVTSRRRAVAALPSRTKAVPAIGA